MVSIINVLHKKNITKMGIILKVDGEVAPVGAEVIFRDALVENGSLLLHDYSNRGTLDNFDLTKGANDLARESSLKLGIDNRAKFRYNQLVVDKPVLSAGKGFRMTWLGRRASGDNSERDFGFNLGRDLDNYLATNQPSKVLMIVWVRVDETIPLGGLFLGASTNKQGATHNYNLRGGSLDVGEVGLGIGGYSMQNTGSVNVMQLGVEYSGPNNKLTRWWNGTLRTNSNVLNAGEFGFPTEDFMIGSNLIGHDSNAIIYRVLVEDLTVSGRTAEEVVVRDWDYCNGIGQFAGKPTKRPFIDLK